MRRLEALVATGGILDPQQRYKLSQRDAYLRANAALERGEPVEYAASPCHVAGCEYVQNCSILSVATSVSHLF